MEKIYHIDQLKDAKIEQNDADVYLKRQHLCLSAEIASQVFGQDRQAYSVYYPDQDALLLAPMSDENFKQLHQCSLIFLKDKNLKGDKSLSLQEVIIDHELPANDRSLPFSRIPGVSLLKVQLKQKP